MKNANDSPENKASIQKSDNKICIQSETFFKNGNDRQKANKCEEAVECSEFTE